VGFDELMNRLVQWVTANPESVVGYGLGVFTAVVLYWLVRWPLHRKIEQLTRQNYDLREDRATFEVRVQTAKLEAEDFRARQRALTEEADDLRRASAKFEARLEAVETEHEKLLGVQEESSRENVVLRDAKARLETRLESALEENQDLRELRERLTAQNTELHEGSSKLQSSLEKALSDRESLQQKVAELSDELEASKESEGDLGQQVSELSEQVQRLADFDGKVWDLRPRSAVPPFLPLDERRVPIIAVANLKGGVGKTTLTANLGATLSKQGKRVLLVDLDYQGSLTSLCLPPAEIREIRRARRFVDRLFDDAAAAPGQLVECSHRVGQLSGVRLLAADEVLADVETRVMAQWIVEPDEGDVRYVLRSCLHSPRLREEYDYVLIDCPPRLTTACVNAFTAADFLLVPVLLDRTSVEAVPRQLEWLRRLKGVICPDLALLGIVGNRTHQRQGELIGREKDVWDSLPGNCRDRWVEPVYRFSALVRDHKAFAEAARNDAFAAFDREVQPLFLDFAKELRARIAKHERQGSPAVPLQPPAAS
jgi:cellulose biosynthesis protein BcsQ